MRYIKFREDKISKLSLGTVQFGLNYGISNKDGKPKLNKVQEIINFVSNSGINCYDTASAYGDSEVVLGKTIQNNNSLIVSKLSSDLFKNALSNIEVSLKNLQLQTMFGLLLHDSSLLHKWKESDTKMVTKLKDKNKIIYFGVSIYTNEDFDLALENDNIEIIQIPFNIFDLRAYKYNWFEKAKVRNKLIFIRSIYLQGLLLMELSDIPKKLKKATVYIEKLDEIANKLEITRIQLIFSFVYFIAKDAILLFGCETLVQAKENLDILNYIKELDKDMIHTIYNIFKDVEESIYNPTKW